ncbi:hypothetical protein BB776_04305 [Planococcus salinarum]|uniref:Uncharacterized protein n=1 Tax=Planococcus salinarum TaxID=622695 RepID=A0ABX3CVM3_9BACL|nr:hypothetical protein BB776_04305 [Planococcus salinarum]
MVYRIQSEENVTGTNLIESDNMETYDVESAEDFESFIHMERTPVEGRSIFLNHRDLDKLAKEINEEIQRNHREQ